MSQNNRLGEALLRAWLELTATIWDRDLVSGMTFNEAVVCNLISHRMSTSPQQPITATELCEKINMRKSQMNQILTSLEGQGYLLRSRNEKDRRQVNLTLTHDGLEAYMRSHEKAHALLDAVVERLGDQEAEKLTRNLQIANAIAQEQIASRRQKGNV